MIRTRSAKHIHLFESLFFTVAVHACPQVEKKVSGITKLELVYQLFMEGFRPVPEVTGIHKFPRDFFFMA